MAEQDISKYTSPDNKIRIMIQDPNRPKTQPVSREKPTVSDSKPTVKQKLTYYAFGEEVEKPAERIWETELKPRGKRLINELVESALIGIKHMVQRKLFDGKVLDNDRINYQSFGKNGGTGPMQKKTYKMMAPVKELTFVDYSNALQVLIEMKKIIASDERCVTVGKYYELADAPEEADANSFTSGWLNLDSVTKPVEAPGGGFVLKLPPPVSLKVR